MTTFVFLSLLVVLILLGAPIGFAMALIPTVYILITGEVPLTSIPYQMYSSLDKFPLVAVPLFLLAGELMNLGAVTDRLLNLSRELVGRIGGGLSHITVVMSMLFASLNGSAVASTATIGGIIPPSIAIVLFAMSPTNRWANCFPLAFCRASWSAFSSWACAM